jgi:GTP-binding protein
MKPIVSIVGRPNVGKSTLFNRLVGYKKAITEDIPGVTRDRNYGEFEYSGKEFVLVDTGGFEPGREESLEQRKAKGAEFEKINPLVREHIYLAMEESSMIIFLMDVRDGLLPEDREIATTLRRYNKPVFFVANKVDSKKSEVEMADFYRLGIEKLYGISAAHGLGLDELLFDMARLADAQPPEEPVPGIKIAFVGRPNTGKSSIVNGVLGSERMIVSDVPGTTRDAIDSIVEYDGKPLTIIDTAGLRKKSRIAVKVEEYSVMSAIRSIERADVVNLVMDGKEGIGHQDATIAHLVVTQGKGIGIIVNKRDLMDPSVNEDDYRKMVKQRLPHADFAPVLFTSAINGENIERILDMDTVIYQQMTRRIATPKLNRALEEFFQRLAPPVVDRKPLKIFYASQLKVSPPTFILFANYPERIPEHYRRYLENNLREKFGFRGAPIRLFFRKRN